MAVKTYEDNGIKLSKKTLYNNDKLKITYNGLLAQSGAENIYMHYGFGNEWASSSYAQMSKTAEGFSAEILILDASSIEICFKDPVDNWDNNSGENYVFKISAKAAKKPEAEKTAEDELVKTEKVKEKKPSKKIENAKESKATKATKAPKEPKESKESKAKKTKKISQQIEM